METSIPTIVWYSGGLVITACLSAIVLSVQRGVYHKSIQLEDHPIEHHLKTDVKRDATVPYADSNRLSRITYITILLTTLAALDLKRNVQQLPLHKDLNVWHISSSVFIFLSWLYATVIAVVSRRYQLPNRWGWVLNVHLCILYTAGWVISVVKFWQVASLDMPWIQSLFFLLPLILGFDLVFVTFTVKQGPPFLDEHDRQVCNINVESIFGILFMNWCTKVVDVVTRKKAELSDKDLPIMTPSFRAHNIFYTFGASRGKDLIVRLISGNSKALIIQVALSIIAAALYYAPAFFMNRLLQFLQDYNDGIQFEDPVRYGILIVVGMGVSITVMGIFVVQQWYYATCVVQSKVRTMLHVEIYRKSLRRRDLSVSGSKERGDKEDEEEDNDTSASTGAIVNLMGTDASRIADFSALWFVIISAPVELAIGIYFLYQLMGISCIYGLLVMVFILPINHFNSKYFAKTQDRLMKARDKRVSLMAEVLQGIRQIKFFAWEANWEKRVMEARGAELHQLAITYINGVFFSLVWQGAPILVTLVSFFVFTKIQGNQLTAPIAFTVISIFSELRFALNVIPETMIQAIQAYSSVKRIQKFLDEDEIESVVRQDPHQTVKLSFDKATIGWKAPSTTKTDGNNEESFILKEISAKFPNEELSLISGATGSGKTLMLLGLLGEAVLLDGNIACPRVPLAETIESESDATAEINPDDWILDHALAYVSQSPWLQNASIRDNILFGLPYIESRYKETLSACALDKDMSILEDGDRTEVGEKGITLSGGQKARVALARAVYSRAKNVLMDDVLSAVDAHTAKHLYEQCLMGPLMKSRTRVLVTHHVRLCLKGCGLLVHIVGGRASHVGSPAELRQSGSLAQIIDEEDQEAEQEHAVEVSTTEEIKPAAAQGMEETVARILIEDEGRASGAVKFRLYKIYFGMVGKTLFWITMCLIVFGGRGLEIGESWWVKTWAQAYDRYSHEEENYVNATFASLTSALNSHTYSFGAFKIFGYTDNISINEKLIHHEPSDGQIHLNYYLGIYCVITMSNVLVGALRYGYLYWGALRANRNLYAELLHRVFRAPLRFFDTTPMGRILNRFSKDFESIDSRIPTDFMIFWINWLVIVSSAITVCCVLPTFILPMTVITVANILIGMSYVSSSRELKRLDSVTRSPLFSNFTETISGVATIRAFGASRQFLRVMMDCIDANVRPFFYSWSVNRWVSIRYSLSSAIINCAACAFTLWNFGRLDVALAGFGLSFVLMFTDSMFWGVRQYTNLEMSFNAIERIVEFMEMDQEAPAFTSIRPPLQWPTQGGIEVRDLEIRYASDLDPVIKDLSFSVKPREKIGIVGRTGSGKSTLALSFFRFVEASAGSIVIDGIDIKDLGTEDLRSNLTIIPQDPTLFSGTLRSNMDPFDQFDNEAIYTALRRVHLLPDEDNPYSTSSGYDSSISLNEANANVFKDLSTMVSEGGKNFSQGQRQLLCLSRALLKKTGIVLMDEATASVDFETDKAIQKTISTEFSDSTILCIAHRLHTVIEYDRILVLNQGRIEEFDHPYTLISNPASSFYKMCRNSGEFESLYELAEAKHHTVNA